MRHPKLILDRDKVLLVERFSPIRRLEHIVAMATFIVLLLTGFPQRFYELSWAPWLLSVLGGIDQVRTIHRVAGLVFSAHMAAHLGVIVVGTLSRRMQLTMLPTMSDVYDAWRNLAYYLGHRQHPPTFPKFDYRQKFEYVGMVLGGLVMVLSGLVLIYPVGTASFLPGEVIPAARMAHSNEAMLAMLVLIVWHVYGAHLSPEVFPVDRSVFTGYTPVKVLKERHLREYQRLFGDRDPEQVFERLLEEQRRRGPRPSSRPPPS